MSLLETINVVKRFGGLIAVNRVSFKLDAGRIISIIEIGRASCRERV